MWDELIDRARRGEATAEEVGRLHAWRRESPVNERQYRATVAVLDAARTLATVTSPDSPPAVEIIARSMSRPHRTGHHAVRWVPWLIAAAATGMAVVALRSRDAPPTPVVSTGEVSEIVTGVAELATITLAGGSVVRLAPQSRLNLDVLGDHMVELEGRGFFAIRAAPARAVRVHTRTADVEAGGSRFELVSDTSGLQLRVVEGRVSLLAEGGPVRIAAGEEIAMRDGAISAPIRIAAPAVVASWTGQFLAFQATPLDEAARELERVYATRVRIADSTLARRPVTATFTDHSLEQVVDSICTMLDVRCVVRQTAVRIGPE